jgi:alpha-glucoside transport system substrate-binding protein
VLPGPGELAAYASQGRLQPLDGLIDTKDFDAPWTPMIPGKDKVPRDYWVPIKTDLKSLVWYPDGMSAQQRGAYAADPGSWCLGLVSAATSGWPATDWLEDVLLQQTGRDTYEKWATGRLRWTDPAVRRAWQTWGAMVGAGKGSYTRPALDRPYDKVSRTEVNGRPPCTLEHQASFVRTEKGWSHDAGYVHSKELVPGARADQDAWEVSGDLAAVLHGTPQARKLISYLARSDVQARWSLSQAGFSADHAVDQSVYGTDPVTKDIAKIIDGPKTVRCYDASDAMPAVMRDAFELAAMRYFAEPTTLTEQLANLESVRQRHGLQWLPKVCGG